MARFHWAWAVSVALNKTTGTAPQRGLLDVDMALSIIPRLLLAVEFVYGMEADGRRVDDGVAEVRDGTWLGVSVTAHYDILQPLGVTVRYDVFDNPDGRRIGLDQTLHAWTIAPVIHLSSLLPHLGVVGAVSRSRHAIHRVDLRLEYRLDMPDENGFIRTNGLDDTGFVPPGAHRLG